MATPSEQRIVVRVTTLDNLTTRWEELTQLAGEKSANAIAFAESLLLQAANHRRGEQT